MAPQGTAVRGAIARAAEASGVDFSYLLAQAKIESRLNPSAKAATSSAAGLYQFTTGTWMDTLRKHGAELGLAGDDGTPATTAALSDPAARAQLMALRFDPEASARMAAALAGDNHVALTNALGRKPDASELYLAHFLGSDGAARFLSALAANPAQAAMSVVPKAAASNRAIFFDGSGNPRTLAGVMDLIRGKVANAMQEPDSTQAAGFDGLMPGFDSLNAVPQPEPLPTGGPLARQFAAVRDRQFAGFAGAGGDQPTLSMSETLASGFANSAEATGGNTPDFVRTAYARIRALGL